MIIKRECRNLGHLSVLCHRLMSMSMSIYRIESCLCLRLRRSRSTEHNIQMISSLDLLSLPYKFGPHASTRRIR